MDSTVISRVLAVASGGALGAVARYAASGFVSRLTSRTAFPWGTLSVNLVGAFALGILLAATTSGRLTMSPSMRTFLAIGVLGAFTTFSTFSYETLEAFRLRDFWIGGANVVASVVFGLVACWAGMMLGQRM
jgi:fluoride exporter